MYIGNKVFGKTNSFHHMQVSGSWKRTEARLVLLGQCFSMAVASGKYSIVSSDDYSHLLENPMVGQGRVNASPGRHGIWVTLTYHLAVLEPRTTRR